MRRLVLVASFGSNDEAEPVPNRFAANPKEMPAPLRADRANADAQSPRPEEADEQVRAFLSGWIVRDRKGAKGADRPQSPSRRLARAAGPSGRSRPESRHSTAAWKPWRSAWCLNHMPSGECRVIPSKTAATTWVLASPMAS